MPKTLIVPFDGSESAERALLVAKELARRFEGCSVVGVTSTMATDDNAKANREEILDRLTAEGCGSDFFHGVEPGVAVTRAVGAYPDAMVCMASHARGRATAAFLGSVATEVIRQASTAVVLVGPKCATNWWHEPPRVVTCWGGDDSSGILAVSKSWAESLAAEINLTWVFHPLDLHMAKDPSAEFQPALDELGGGVTVELSPLVGEWPAGAIVAHAQERQASLVAMATHARTGIARAVLGSITMQVVHDAPCPVLVVRQAAD